MRKNRGKERRTVPLHDRAFTKASESFNAARRSEFFERREERFWSAFYEIVGDKKVTLAWLHKFFDVVSGREWLTEDGRVRNFTHAVQQDLILPTCFLQYDSDGYAIKPHTDGGTTKVITTLLYLPEREVPSAGTLVLRKINVRKHLHLRPSTLYFNNIRLQVEEVSRMSKRNSESTDIFVVEGKGKFRSNSLLSFGVCSESYHAVPKQTFDTHLRGRRSIPCFISYRDGHITGNPGRCFP